MNKFTEALVKNHKAFRVPVEYLPKIPARDRVELRLNLIEEELQELYSSCDEGNIVEAADALIDILYVTVGAMLEFGLTDIIDDLFDEVQRSNMSKLGPDNRPIYREDGKYLKGPNYSPPNLRAIIEKKIKEF